jgi:UDP:flavonoid glycosyltransferase YjiC (YdhE family)
MRVLMTTTAYPGHVLPLVPFAHAFGRAGHEVCIAGPRSAAPMIEREGIDFCGTADPPEQEVRRLLATASELTPAAGHAYMVAEGFAGTATRVALADMLQVAGACRPDVVVRESHEFAGLLAAEYHRIPHARVALGLASGEAESLSLAAPAIAAFRAELGLAAEPRPEPCLTQVPAAFERPGAQGPPATTHRFREAPGGAEPLPDLWPDDDDPLVYVTFGSVAGRLGFFPALHRAACEVLADLPVRVLVTVGDHDPADLGPLPPNVRAERWIPQAVVARRAAAVVCHGGYGTVLGTLAYGLPLVLLPLFAGDQWDNARRVAEVDAGICLEREAGRMLDHPEPAVLASLSGAVRAVLDEPRYRAGAARVAAAIDTLPTIDAAADALPAIARREEVTR